MDDVLREHVSRCAVEAIGLVNGEAACEDLNEVGAALGHVVVQQLDPVDTHEAKQRIVALLEVALAELQLDGGELSPEHLHEEVPRPRC